MKIHKNLQKNCSPKVTLTIKAKIGCKRCILLLIALVLQAQAGCFGQKAATSHLSVTGGYSLPVGRLAKEKADDPLAGLAGAGYHGGISYDVRVTRRFGLKFSASMNRNKTHARPILSVADSYVEQIKALVNETTSHSWNTRVSNWKFDAVMGGPVIFLDLRRLQIEGHLQCGYVHITSPSVDMQGNFQSGKNQILVRLNKKSLGGFGAGAGVSLRLPISGPLYMHFSGDFIATKAALNDVAVTVRVGTYPEVNQPVDEKRFVGVANVGMGLGFAF